MEFTQALAHLGETICASISSSCALIVANGLDAGVQLRGRDLQPLPVPNDLDVASNRLASLLAPGTQAPCLCMRAHRGCA
jgi:adenine-specific DNA glycosylase